MADILTKHENAKSMVDKLGWDGFVEWLEHEFGENFYSCSTHWYFEKKYICKLKGSQGDLIIGWDGVHNID